jgi:hypothetical protein
VSAILDGHSSPVIHVRLKLNVGESKLKLEL